MGSFNNQTILVFGGAGFIGSNFIHGLLKKDPRVRVVNVDKLTYSGNPDNLKDLGGERGYTFIRGDVANADTVTNVFKKYKPSYIINFAAETHVDRSIHVGAKEFILTNILGVFNILEAAKKTKTVKKYVQVSTDEVYGSLRLAAKEKFNETTRFSPSVPYAATKAGGDHLCHAYFKTWNVPVVVTHCSNNYGPYQYPEKLIPFFITRMLENKKVPLYGDGKNVRDWIFVLDHCRALELCLLGGVPGESYHIGANHELSNLDIATGILKRFGRDKKWIEFVSDRPGHDRRYAIDASKIKRELGWKPAYSFAEAFAITIDWYINNKEWINRVRKKTGVFNPHIDLWKAHSKNKK